MPSILTIVTLLGTCSDDPQMRSELSPFNIEEFHRAHLDRCRRRIAFIEQMIAFEELMMNDDPRRFPVEQARRNSEMFKDELGKMKRMLREHESWTPPPGGVFTSPSQWEELDRAIERRRKLYYQLWPPTAPQPREKK